MRECAPGPMFETGSMASNACCGAANGRWCIGINSMSPATYRISDSGPGNEKGSGEAPTLHGPVVCPQPVNCLGKQSLSREIGFRGIGRGKQSRKLYILSSQRSVLPAILGSKAIRHYLGDGDRRSSTSHMGRAMRRYPPLPLSTSNRGIGSSAWKVYHNCSSRNNSSGLLSSLGASKSCHQAAER